MNWNKMHYLVFFTKCQKEPQNPLRDQDLILAMSYEN